MEELARLQLTVGVHGANNPDRGDGINQAGIAAVHEFGSEHVPERSFIRSTLTEKDNYAKPLASVTKKVMKGELGAKEALELVGTKAKGDIQQKIAKGVGPALDPKTIKRKGSSKQLIDTGQLRQSIDYEVK